MVYTSFLDDAGGFRADLTIMRLGPQHFRVVTGGATGMADYKWITDHLPEDGSAAVADVTSAWTTFGLWGPKARAILGHLTGDDISNAGFGFGTCRDIEAEGMTVLASRISYVGELGWELYVPVEQGAKLWDALFSAGLAYGMVPAGIGVYGTTGRLEKGYRAYGAELDASYTLVEAGMTRPKVKEQDFGEPVLSAAGEPLTDGRGRRSYVTSAGSGPSVGRHLLLAYLPPEQAVAGTPLAVEYLGEQYPVTVAVAGSTPLFDPANERVRS